jgi:hypothetical protein
MPVPPTHGAKPLCLPSDLFFEAMSESESEVESSVKLRSRKPPGRELDPISPSPWCLLTFDMSSEAVPTAK